MDMEVNSRKIYFEMQLVVGTCTYRSLIGMNMTSKHDINFVLDKPWLIHYSHCFTFHIVIIVTIIPGGMH